MGTAAAAGESPAATAGLAFCHKEPPSWWEVRAGRPDPGSVPGNTVGLSLTVSALLVAVPGHPRPLAWSCSEGQSSSHFPSSPLPSRPSSGMALLEHCHFLLAGVHARQW